MDKHILGTPKSLDEAVVQALMVGPLAQIRERAYNVFKEFLAERFGAAILKHPEHAEVLRELYDDLIKRP